MFPANNLEKYFVELNNQNWTLIPVDMEFVAKLQKSAKSKFNSNQFRPARVSHSDETLSEIRNDSIFWLDAKSEALLDIDIAALDALKSLTETLKNYFRVSLTEFECHFAIYPPGHFYKRHQDITTENNKRIFSFVIYLNESWSSDNGGELIGFNQENIIFKITPTIGHMILFKSELEHEVLKTNKMRYSLTGWVRK